MDDVNAAPADAGSAPDPVDLITGLLERENNPQPSRPRDQNGKFASQNPDPVPEPEEPEQPEQPEPGPETPPDDGGDEDGDEAPEQPDAAPDDEPELYEVKVGDRVEKVTREELLRGYQRQSDYSRHMNSLAEQRRAAEAATQQVTAERQHYAAQLDQFAAVLQTSLPPRPPQEMLDTDPIGYLQQEKAWEARATQLQQVFAEKQRVEQQMAEHREVSQREMLQRAREQLTEMLPEWRRPETAKAEQPKIAQHLRSIGYADHEISAAADPRAIVMARESMLYRQLMASKPAVQQKIATAPKMVRPGAAGPAPDQRKAVIGNIKRSGGKDMDAIARLIELG
jgi:hypothetical protein